MTVRGDDRSFLRRVSLQFARGQPTRGVVLLAGVALITMAIAIDGVSGGRVLPFMWQPILWDAGELQPDFGANAAASSSSQKSQVASQVKRGSSAPGESSVDAGTPASTDKEPSTHSPDETPTPTPAPIAVSAPDPAAEPPVFTLLVPEPFSTVKPGDVVVEVVATSGNVIESVVVELEGEELDVELAVPIGNSVTVTAEEHLSSGVYTATAALTDRADRVFHAQWDFVVADNENESIWFYANGNPKADQINATLNWLVDTSRWHLLGETLNVIDPPELATHSSEVGEAEPVGTWVRGTTFDHEYTEATLKSLIEAHRWHYWGITWEGQPEPDLPTHADEVHEPRSIREWFTPDGEPIRANIEDSLRRLVEVSRWHYWGHSWDGNRHHDDVPTHRP